MTKGFDIEVASFNVAKRKLFFLCTVQVIKKCPELLST